MSTLGHVQYTKGYHYECGRIPCVHRGMFSTSENYHQYMGGGGGIVVLAFVFRYEQDQKREKLNDVSFDVHVFFQQQQESENIQS